MRQHASREAASPRAIAASIRADMLVACAALSAIALLCGCSIDPQTNPVYGCHPSCEMCIRGFCYDAPDPPDAAVPDAMSDAMADASPIPGDGGVCEGGAPDATCPVCEGGCPEGELCCRGACAAECRDLCGNATMDPGEQCDGGPLCSSSCTLLFHPALVHRYQFNGRGTDAIDAVGAANGKLVNVELKGTGDLVLAGGKTDQYVDLPNGPTRALTSITLEMWLTWHGGAAGQRLFDFGYNMSGEQNTGLGTSYIYATPQNLNGNLAAHINFTLEADQDKDTVAQAGGALSRDIRHHVAVVFDGRADAFLLYLDGTNVETVNGVRGMLAQIDARNVWIGRANAPAESLNATVHEFRIYKEALNAEAIAQSRQAGSDPGGAVISE